MGASFERERASGRRKPPCRSAKRLHMGCRTAGLISPFSSSPAEHVVSLESRRHVKPLFIKKKFTLEELENSKKYSVSNTIVFKTIKFVPSKHFMGL